MSKCKCEHDKDFTPEQLDAAIHEAAGYTKAPDAPCLGTIVGKLFFHPEKLSKQERYLAAGGLVAGSLTLGSRREARGVPPEIAAIKAMGEAMGLDVSVTQVTGPEELLRAIMERLEPKNKTTH